MEEHLQQGDYAGRTVIQDQSYGFHIHQAKFVQERLSPIVIPRGRRSDKKSETTDGEKRQWRAVWGSINWVQRESRPDVSALVSLGMGSLTRSTVQDLCDANVAVERLKAEPFLGVKLPHIPIHHVRWATSRTEELRRLRTGTARLSYGETGRTCSMIIGIWPSFSK